MKFKKFLFIFTLFCLFCLSLFLITSGITNLFNLRYGEVISKKSLEKIKYEVSSQTNKSAYLNLSSFQGNSKFVALTYTDERYSGKENTFNVIYDVKNSNIIKNIKYKNISLNILDALSITYIDKNTFIVIDSSGNIYNVNLSNNRILLIDNISLSNKTYFKSIYSDNSLYVISRNYFSKFNEKLLNSNILYKIDFNKKFTEANIETIEFDNKLLYSFVVDLNGNVGIVYSDCIYVSGEEVAKYKLISDSNYLSALPTENNKYKFIDSNSIKIKFLNIDKELDVDPSFIENDFINIHHELNNNLNLNVSSPRNIPFVVGDNLSYYFNESYEDRVYDLPLYSTTSVLVEANNKLSSSSLTSRSELLIFDYKNYIGFIITTDGLVGIDKNGDTNTILKTKLAYAHENYILYLKDGELFCK